jgi:hypothetical protein
MRITWPLNVARAAARYRVLPPIGKTAVTAARMASTTISPVLLRQPTERRPFGLFMNGMASRRDQPEASDGLSGERPFGPLGLRLWDHAMPVCSRRANELATTEGAEGYRAMNAGLLAAGSAHVEARRVLLPQVQWRTTAIRSPGTLPASDRPARSRRLAATPLRCRLLRRGLGPLPTEPDLLRELLALRASSASCRLGRRCSPTDFLIGTAGTRSSTWGPCSVASAFSLPNIAPMNPPSSVAGTALFATCADTISTVSARSSLRAASDPASKGSTGLKLILPHERAYTPDLEHRQRKVCVRNDLDDAAMEQDVAMGLTPEAGM